MTARSTPPPLRMLSVAETALALGISEKTVRRLIQRRELRAHRFGRCLRMSDDDLRLYLNRARG